jgi:hypothetical protein
MFVPRTTVLSVTLAGLALSLTACSALTRPDEITIVAEPLPSPDAVAANDAPAPAVAPGATGGAPEAKQGG